MYCDRCGSPLAPSTRFCGTCGKAFVAAATPVPVYAGHGYAAPVHSTAAYDGRVARHVSVLALLWCINGILRLMETASILVIGRAMVPWMGRSFGFPWGMRAFPALGLWWAFAFFACFGVVHLVLAWSLYERKPWARMLGLIVGFLALIRFPFGTALGIYTIWVLLPESSGREYDQLAHA